MFLVIFVSALFYGNAAADSQTAQDPQRSLNPANNYKFIAAPTSSPTPVSTTVTFQSVAAQDGWVLESSETSNIGGALNSSADAIYIGDDAARRQYRGILSFNTGASLPDNAIITGVTLKIKQKAISGGGNPVTTFQGFMFDLRKGYFGVATLQVSDFQSAADYAIGPFSPATVSGWYSINLTSAKAYLNKLSTGSGLSQIRVRFKLDDNNNTISNFLCIYSGNAVSANRPQLIITYSLP